MTRQLLCHMEWSTSKYFKHTEPQKKHGPKKYDSQFSVYVYNEILYMCNDKILVQW